MTTTGLDLGDASRGFAYAVARGIRIGGSARIEGAVETWEGVLRVAGIDRWQRDEWWPRLERKLRRWTEHHGQWEVEDLGEEAVKLIRRQLDE